MTEGGQEHPTVEQEYRNIVEGALQRAHAAAEILTKAGKPGVDFSISVIPRNPRAAAINLEVVERNVVFLHMGQGTTFEFPKWFGIGLGGHTELEQIDRLTTAVAEGKFEEDLFYCGDELVAGKGVVHLSDIDVPMRWRRLKLGLFRRKSKRHIAYEPYS